MKVDDMLSSFKEMPHDEQRLFLNRAIRLYADSECNSCSFVDICNSTIAMGKPPCAIVPTY